MNILGKLLLVLSLMVVPLMFIGGCTDSTGGDIKVVRFLLLFNYAKSQLNRLMYLS